MNDPYPQERYLNESKRLLNVLNQRLDGRAYVMGDDYTIADIAISPWVNALNASYRAGDIIGLHDYPNVVAYVAKCMARPAVAKGMVNPPR